MTASSIETKVSLVKTFARGSSTDRIYLLSPLGLFIPEDLDEATRVQLSAEDRRYIREILSKSMD
jgi:hypothetical protein